MCKYKSELGKKEDNIVIRHQFIPEYAYLPLTKVIYLSLDLFSRLLEAFTLWITLTFGGLLKINFSRLLSTYVS